MTEKGLTIVDMMPHPSKIVSNAFHDVTSSSIIDHKVKWKLFQTFPDKFSDRSPNRASVEVDKVDAISVSSCGGSGPYNVATVTPIKTSPAKNVTIQMTKDTVNLARLKIMDRNSLSFEPLTDECGSY